MSPGDVTSADYFDSSFLLASLLADDARHDVARSVLRDREHRVTSVVAEVEVLRALARRGAASRIVERARNVLRGFALVDLSPEIRAAAIEMRPTVLRSLDAIHLSTAVATGAHEFHTFDERQRVAAEDLGLAVNAR